MNQDLRNLPLKFHVDPQFVHRTLAAQALGVDETATIAKLADQLIEAIIEHQIPDIRVTAIKKELDKLEARVATVRSGFYFRRTGSGISERIIFHRQISVDEDTEVTVEGEFDPRRFEANSPAGNLSGHRHVFIAGVVRKVDEGARRLVMRPFLIGFPYFAPKGERDGYFPKARPEVFCGQVDQFGLDDTSTQTRVTESDLVRLFKMPERQVKEAFGEILKVSSVPADWGGENSDLMADVSIDGVWARTAFAFKGPGGKPKPWTLYPANMGLRGDQALRLFAELADIMVVQHCSRVAEAVRHLMDALAVSKGKRYMILSGEHTVRILNKAGLLAP